MRNTTCEYLCDVDVNIPIIEKRLRNIAELISINNKNNLTDINVICEEIFGKILNKLYDLELVSTSAKISGNYVAVDLIDYNKRIAYQVTSQQTAEKIRATVTKFNNSELYKDIDEVNILVLKMDEHHYRREKLFLSNGKEFSCSNNIINLKKLIKEIENKEFQENGFVVEIYDIISMVYDSGRLNYVNIVNETASLLQDDACQTSELKACVKGYGDIQLSAFIPLTYEKQLSCIMRLRQHNISGISIAFNQDELIRDYFVSEQDFKTKHNIGRYEDEDEICLQMQNCRFNVNVHTAFHAYKLFQELKKEFLIEKNIIDNALGIKDFRRDKNGYILMYVEKCQWEEMLFFARNHDYCQCDDELEWSIFNNNCKEDSLTLSPNIYGSIHGDILSRISVVELEENCTKMKLYWNPGYKANVNCMEGFDNIIKWKADYTKEWIENVFLEKAHKYYEKCNGKKSFLMRIQEKLKSYK